MLARTVMSQLPDHGWSVLAFTTVGTAVSVAITIPVAMLIAQYVPWISGSAPAPSKALKGNG